MEAPEVRYAKSGDVNIAYSVVGDGPLDLVFVSGWVLSALEHAWEGPPAEFFRRLATFSRLILFDKRGTGLSDRATGIPDLETRMDDIRAVMDAVGSERAAVMGFSEGGPMTLLFAATYPERTAAAILYGSRASYLRADDYPWGLTPEEWAEDIQQEASTAGTQEWLDEWLRFFAPSMARDEAVRRWWRRWVLTSASPGAVVALRRMNSEIDACHALPAIRVPTLVLHRVGDGEYVGQGRYIAERIPGAELVELPGDDHAYFVDPEPIAQEVERFVRGIWDRGEWDVIESDRVLATVLFTDIVGSTAKLAELGDRRWRELLQHHHALVRRQLVRFSGREIQLVRFSGREIDTAGDGFFASFDGPARAIRCACEITEAVRELGLDVRAGLHTGECELVEGKVGGIAVHIGARVAAEAAPGEVLVSSTVKDLVAGSGIRFSERGAVELKGVPGEWRLYSVEQGAAIG
ncbi:MAG: adenylate/guanylate cyclase domain-containing protein [Actinobacteria bacterium]|nr:adenylate/guanylate cyclase domain-containing protein [Actinomycetota bacterium]